MLIEKTTLIAFDEVAERKRILSVFMGQRQQHLLTALDLMVAGDFVALARAVVRTMPDDIIQYMAIPMQDVINGVIEQKVSETEYAEGTGVAVTVKQRELMGMRGIPLGKESTLYPRFSAFTPAPAAASDIAPAPAG